MKESNKSARRKRIQQSIRTKISGTAGMPRLAVFRSNTEIYAQLIDDANGLTIVSASSKDKDLKAQTGTKTDKSKMVGQAVARKAVALGVTKVAFDRGGYLYHGRVKSLADGAREGGLQF